MDDNEPPMEPTKEGYIFKGWYLVTSTDPETLSDTAFDFDTAITGDITLKAVWEAEPVTEHVFSQHNLLLSSEIGVQFKITLPEGMSGEGSSMNFSVSDGRTGSMTAAEATAVDGENAYWFTCRINTLELADTITAVYQYGEDGEAVEDTYFAMRYIAAAKEVYAGKDKLMTYVYAVIREGSSFTAEKQNAMTAYYNYYASAVDYAANK